jgi:hypothetical protein
MRRSDEAMGEGRPEFRCEIEDQDTRIADSLYVCGGGLRAKLTTPCVASRTSLDELPTRPAASS